MDEVIPTVHDNKENLSVTLPRCFSEKQQELFQSQLLNSHVNKHGHRWPHGVISLCLTIWNRSPKAYENMLHRGSLMLPCTKTLSCYKNCVEQKSGINHDILKGMYLEAQRRDTPTEGYYGGLVFDEMSIQDVLHV